MQRPVSTQRLLAEILVDLETAWPIFNVHLCANLEQLGLYVEQMPSPRLVSWGTLCNLIACLTCERSLQSLTLEHDYLPYSANKLEEWALMRATLSRFDVLHELVFVDGSFCAGERRDAAALAVANVEMPKHLATLSGQRGK